MVHLMDAEDGLRLMDVEGELQDAEVTSWSESPCTSAATPSLP
jgi:hypothetical protein